MNFATNTLLLKRHSWLIGIAFAFFTVMFSLYVTSEKAIETAHSKRLKSHELADEIRQSSDDLTRMARSYVMTKNLKYKTEFQKIIDIRDGIAPRPLHARNLYVDLSGIKDSTQKRYTQAEPLLSVIKKEGFTTDEIVKLSEAKKKSDELVILEREAMELAQRKPASQANMNKAIEMVFSDSFDAKKAMVALPILEVEQHMDERTLKAIEDAKLMANVMRMLFLLSGLALIILLWHTYKLWEKLYRELETARNKAEAAQEAKSGFMANMSHEIRTPLNGIVGFVNLLAKSPLSNEQNRYISIIQNSIESLMVIVNDILDFSKIQEGKKEMELFDINPKVEFEKSFLLFEPKAKDKNIEYKILLDGMLAACIKIDLFLIKQVMLNLINNAIKFTPENGKIKISVTVLEDKNSSQKLAFEVEDNGPGISKEALETIFDKFTQADISTTRTHGGTGLGLSIAYSLVEMMGGILCVESEEGKGTVFSFELNVDKCPEKIKVTNSLASEIALNDVLRAPDLRVLVAEDQDVNQMLINEYLKRYQIRADFANNGEEAVGLAHQNEYDLILMDINMPIMDGIEATRLIRQTYPELLIVALTANALEGDYEKFMEAGMNEYLVKPINVPALEAILRHVKNVKIQG